MARWSQAAWKPVKNWSGSLRPIAVTLHHQYGNGSLQQFFNGPQQTSAHFWIAKNGRAEQYVDTAHRAWHGIAHNNYGIGVETEGCARNEGDRPMTDAQLNTFAALMRWAKATHGIPLRLSEDVKQAGLNYHRCKGGPATACPCSIRVNQRAEILRRAGGATAPPPPPKPTPPSGGAAPPLHVDYFDRAHNSRVGDVRTWQNRMAQRGWSIKVDQDFGPESDRVCRQFQAEKGLGVDGKVGPQTWKASWSAPVT
jgi:hypothetical protein